MSWTVKWEPAIFTQVTYLWVQSPDPKAVRDGYDAVNRALGADLYAAGRHQSEGLWRAEVPPLVVQYEIDPDARLVTITAVAVLP